MAPDTHGIHFVHLPAGSVIDAGMVQGNLRLTDCARASLLFRTSYEGSVTIEGAEPTPRDGLIGFLTRLTTASRPALRVFDNQSVVMSDFYTESSDQIAILSGTAGQAAGAVTIQAPKVQMSSGNLVFDIQNYGGRIYYGQSQFYCDPPERNFRSVGNNPVQLLLAGNYWYNSHPTFGLSPATRLTVLGNSGAADVGVTPAALADVAVALDDLRRLGKLDYDLSHSNL
jgi:hypothetical protein